MSKTPIPQGSDISDVNVPDGDTQARKPEDWALLLADFPNLQSTEDWDCRLPICSEHCHRHIPNGSEYIYI